MILEGYLSNTNHTMVIIGCKDSLAVFFIFNFPYLMLKLIYYEQHSQMYLLYYHLRTRWDYRDILHCIRNSNLVYDTRQASSQSTKLDIWSGLDNSVCTHGHCCFSYLEERINPPRCAKSSVCFWTPTYSQRIVVYCLLWFAQSSVGACEYCRLVACDHLDHGSFLQAVSPSHVASPALYSLGQFCCISQLLHLDTQLKQKGL